MRSYTSKGRQNNLRPAFEIDGEVFRGDGTISLMDLSELARLAAAGFDDGSVEGIGMIADIYRSILGDQEFTRFRRHCREHDVDGKLLMEIIAGIIAEAGDRPTERPSDLPDGPPAGGGTARVVSFSRGTVEEKPIEPTTETGTGPQERRVVSYG